MVKLSTFRVALLLTDRCNIKCAHCWFESEPEKQNNMEFRKAIQFIDLIHDVSTVEWISFTGGEPFLLPNMLRNLISYSSEKGFLTECVTNCFWAETEETAERILDDLVEAGLEAINISSDGFHQKHIPFERVKNCYDAAKKVGLKIVIMSSSSKSSKFRMKDITKSLGGAIMIVGESDTTTRFDAMAIESGFIPAGRGAQLPEEEWLIGQGLLSGPCDKVLRDIGITPSGDVLPCCSAASIIEGVKLGNLNSKTLEEILEEASERQIFQVLSKDGPEGLVVDLDFRYTLNCVNKCHLCYRILIDLDS